MNQKSFARFQVIFGILTIIVFLLLIYGISYAGGMIEQLRPYPRSNDIYNFGLFFVFIMLIIAGILYIVNGVSKIIGRSKKFIPFGYLGSIVGIFSSFLVIINGFYSNIYFYVSFLISMVGLFWFLIIILFTFLPYIFGGEKTKKQIKIIGIVIIVGIIGMLIYIGLSGSEEKGTTIKDIKDHPNKYIDSKQVTIYAEYCAFENLIYREEIDGDYVLDIIILDNVNTSFLKDGENYEWTGYIRNITKGVYLEVSKIKKLLE